jgi:cell division protein FtsN
LAQDDYYYEIQLTNKQLVFYFMAGAAGLILSFLAGVMVGRGVEGSAAVASESRTVAEERVVAEPSPSTAAATPAPSDYSYPQRLQSDRPEEGLDRSRPGGTAPPTATPRASAAPVPPVAASTPASARLTPTPAAAKPTPTPAAAKPTPTPAAARTTPTPAAAKPTPAPAVATPTPPPALPTPPPPAATRAAAPASGPLPKALASSAKGFAIQVGAFKDRASADSIVRSLKVRGLPAYVVAPAGGGLFTVRVGVYRDRADAEAVQERLRDDKFKPYIIKQ